ncbi:phosphatidate cytidylyltransferase [Clostridia bacterium]|nr:phosphatidate cytidylyltransferase [Clostridia bacterium]
MLKMRLLSGFVVILFLLAFAMAGGDPLLVALCVVSLIGLFEFYRVMGIESTILGFIGYGATILHYWGIREKVFLYHENLFFFLMIMLCLLLGAYVFTYPKFHMENVMAALFGIAYISLMLSCVYLLRMLPGGESLLWVVFIASWGSDTCAYCAGSLFGKHKLVPILSPKKTIEGAVGGVMGSLMITLLYSLYLRQQMDFSLRHILFLMAIAGVGSLVSMIGDLAASAIKRNYDVKDFGTILPGHGGIIDRFDSVILVAPLVYFLSLYLIK